ncbi:hypothetical protein EW026_g5629 [Hermanssonia centrifuga]|uniref:Uncharacterized protein n=2 Tax=Hermanssonia centrifuga TaxID=98765 RepID=A0A4S4KDS6_9APHY|nr:hypothetical protein PHLCEN_2v11048 [Hermanssonia centrifuga]THG96153.1 hypothetical protein EW026_g5629 [Hermanssonia centrifuga]
MMQFTAARKECMLSMDCLTSKDLTAALHFQKSDDDGGKDTFSCVKVLHKPTPINGVQRDCLPAEFFVIGQVVEEEVQFLQEMQQGGKTITRASFWLEQRHDPTSQVQWERTLIALHHIVGRTTVDVDTSTLFSVNAKTGAMRLRVHASESHTSRELSGYTMFDGEGDSFRLTCESSLPSSVAVRAVFNIEYKKRARDGSHFMHAPLTYLSFV